MTDLNEQLLPCPMCGAAGEHNVEDNPESYWIGCAGCGLGTDTCPDEADAVTAWNRRAPAAAPAPVAAIRTWQQRMDSMHPLFTRPDTPSYALTERECMEKEIADLRAALAAAPAPAAAPIVQPVADERAAFEAWATPDGAQSRLDAAGEYAEPGMSSAWAAWQARAALTTSTADAKDAARLDFMAEHGAWIAWSRDGERCRVFHRDVDGDLGPMMGWVPEAWAQTAREAIDAVRAAITSSAGEVKP